MTVYNVASRGNHQTKYCTAIRLFWTVSRASFFPIWCFCCLKLVSFSTVVYKVNENARSRGFIYAFSTSRWFIKNDRDRPQELVHFFKKLVFNPGPPDWQRTGQHLARTALIHSTLWEWERSVMTPNPPHKASSSSAYGSEVGGGWTRGGCRLHIVPWGQIKAYSSPYLDLPPLLWASCTSGVQDWSAMQVANTKGGFDFF